MRKPLDKIVKSWGESNLHDFNGATNIHPDNRVAAFAVLCDEAISHGYSREELEEHVKPTLDWCIPEKKALKTDAFFSYILRDYFEVLDIKFEGAPSSLDRKKTESRLVDYFRLKITKKKTDNIEKRSLTTSKDLNVEEFKIDTEKDESALNVKNLTKEELEKINYAIVEKRIQESLIDPAQALKNVYRVSKEELDNEFLSVDPEVKKLLGLNDKGEIS